LLKVVSPAGAEDLDSFGDTEEGDGNEPFQRLPSSDTMIREIKRFSNNAILSNLGIKSKLDEGSDIWDVAFFSQTVG